ncbi:MAG: FHA domain-containing protein [Bifidobacteriaceae bacterium]|jgi:hypothetical protein|nr:FHA domain-containing protein [Bifidobacteriaceae bacterium]
MRIGEMARRFWAILSIGEQELTVRQVQAAMESEIVRAGVKTLRGVVYANTVLVYLSPDALDALRPVERQVIVEIERNLPVTLAAAGAEIQGSLRVSVAMDRSLKGLRMRAVAADQDETPRSPSNPVGPGRWPGPSAAKVGLKPDGADSGFWPVTEECDCIVSRRPRDGAQNQGDLQFDDQYVSIPHARFSAERAADGLVRLVMTDLNSRNGTTVDGVGVVRWRPVPLRDGQRIRFGGRDGPAVVAVIEQEDAEATQFMGPGGG